MTGARADRARLPQAWCWVRTHSQKATPCLTALTQNVPDRPLVQTDSRLVAARRWAEGGGWPLMSAELLFGEWESGIHQKWWWHYSVNTRNTTESPFQRVSEFYLHEAIKKIPTTKDCVGSYGLSPQTHVHTKADRQPCEGRATCVWALSHLKKEESTRTTPPEGAWLTSTFWLSSSRKLLQVYLYMNKIKTTFLNVECL